MSNASAASSLRPRRRVLRVFAWLILLVGCGTFTTARAQLATSSWAKFRCNAQNTGVSPGFTAGMQVQWTHTFSAGTNLTSSPVIGPDGTVYFASATDGRLLALNGGTGTVKWAFTGPGSITSTPAIGADGNLYFGGGDGKVYAVNSTSGVLVWTYPTGGPVTSSPALGPDGTVYVGSHDGTVYAITQKGNLKWSHATGGPVYASPALGSDGTVYVGSSDNNFYAFNGSSGMVKWYFVSAGTILSSAALDEAGHVFVGSDDKNLYALNALSGHVDWSFVTGGAVDSSPAILKTGTVVFGSADGKVYGVSTANGVAKWVFQTGGPVNSSPAVTNDGVIFIGSGDAKLYCLGAGGGEFWRFQTLGAVGSSPAIAADGTLYVASNDANLYSFATTYPGPQPILMTVSPNVVPAGITATATLTLDNPALYGGAVVSLSSSKSYASVPATVLVPQGQTTVTFPIATTTTSATATVKITAALDGAAVDVVLTIGAPKLISFVLAPTAVTGGSSSVATVTLSGIARAGGVVVSLSANSKFATVPTAVIVGSGESAVSFPVQTSPVATSQTVMISANTGSAVQTASLTISPAMLQSISMSSEEVVGGAPTSGTVTLSGPAPAGGALIALSSSKSSATVPATVRVLAGQSSAAFTIRTVAVPNDLDVTIAGVYQKARQTTSITVLAPRFLGLTLDPSSVTGGQESFGTISLSSVAPSAGLTAKLSCNVTGVTVPLTVVVLAGRSSARFAIKTKKEATPTIATITGTIGVISNSATLSIN